ncbi:MAG: bifunctional diaminohydroxyphosphoribosylaminopyrimidine deaminase/5-amino-6-(5-phosphoribosylamino)uracil reductase RibD [bacterium]
MEKAYKLAKLGIGKTNPNPLVGAIIVKNDTIVGQGYHKCAGDAHAEIYALNQAGKKAKNADLYVTLEPCSHYGKTPPCTEAIIKAGIKKVFIGIKDSNPLVNGKGIKILKNANIEVKIGILEEKIKEMNQFYAKYITQKIPYVILKVATSLDGKICTETGDSKYITNEISRNYVHKLRSQIDAIIVGIETIKKDNSKLTCRLKKGGNPIRIILDTKGKIPLNSNVITQNFDKKTYVALTDLASFETIKKLEQKDIKILKIKTKNGQIDLNDLLKKLWEMKISNVLVEGGEKVFTSFLENKLVDKIMVFIAPMLIGGKSKTFFSSQKIKKITESIKLTKTSFKKFREDILINNYVYWYN